jgi:hypothetical protein
MTLLIKEFRKCYGIYLVQRLNPSTSPPRKLQNWESAVNEDKETREASKKGNRRSVFLGTKKFEVALRYHSSISMVKFFLSTSTDTVRTGSLTELSRVLVPYPVLKKGKFKILYCSILLHCVELIFGTTYSLLRATSVYVHSLSSSLYCRGSG